MEERRSMYRVLVGDPGEDNIKMDLQEVGYRVWTG
jgi:hypothetical protein